MQRFGDLHLSYVEQQNCLCQTVIKSFLCVSHARTTKYGLQFISTYGAKLWNSIPMHMKECKDIKSFKGMLKSWTQHEHRCTLCISV